MVAIVNVLDGQGTLTGSFLTRPNYF